MFAEGSYKYSVILSSVSVTVSEFTGRSATSKIMSSNKYINFEVWVKITL